MGAQDVGGPGATEGALLVCAGSRPVWLIINSDEMGQVQRTSQWIPMWERRVQPEEVTFSVTSEEFPGEGAWKEAGKLWQPLCEEG